MNEGSSVDKTQLQRKETLSWACPVESLTSAGLTVASSPRTLALWWGGPTAVPVHGQHRCRRCNSVSLQVVEQHQPAGDLRVPLTGDWWASWPLMGAGTSQVGFLTSLLAAGEQPSLPCHHHQYEHWPGPRYNSWVCIFRAGVFNTGKCRFLRSVELGIAGFPRGAVLRPWGLVWETPARCLVTLIGSEPGRSV